MCSYTFCRSRNLIPVANTSTQDIPCNSWKWSGYLGTLGYSDKEVQYACVHASTVLGSWDTLTSGGCSMHVFMPPILSWDGLSISGLMTWYGTTHIPLNFYAI